MRSGRRYARALAESWHRMPAGTLSAPHEMIPMPWPPVNSFMLEPYINPHRCAAET